MPVDEKRFRRLQERTKTPFEIVNESAYQPVPVETQSVEIVRLWLSWTRLIAAGEDPAVFLPTFGIEGRTLTEMRQATLKEAKAEDDDNGLPKEEEEHFSDMSSEVDQDDPESVERARQRKLKKLQELPISDDEADEHEGDTPFGHLDPDIKWATRTLAVAWLQKARKNLQNPQLQDWAQPLPPDMFEAQRGLPRVPHSINPPPMPPPPMGSSSAVGITLPPIPQPPAGGAAAVTGPAGVPPAPNLAPPPGSAGFGSAADSAGGQQRQ